LQSTLRVDGGLQRVRRGMESCAKRIADNSEDYATICFDGLAEESVMTREEFRQGTGELLGQGCAALYVGKEESDSARGP
jgi:hypothetical protein